MSLERVLAMAAIVCFIVLSARGQDEHAPQQNKAPAQIENCQAAMQVIIKNYNDAKYAVQQARWAGDRGHILDAVNAAQLSLNNMEEPLKVCSEALQNVKSDQPSSKNN
jgi:hypothetical protein